MSKKKPGRSNRVWNRIAKLNGGVVLCFCCGLEVERKDATVEHVVPVARGGCGLPSNTAISHFVCNQRRGAPDPAYELPIPFGIYSSYSWGGPKPMNMHRTGDYPTRSEGPSQDVPEVMKG